MKRFCWDRIKCLALCAATYAAALAAPAHAQITVSQNGNAVPLPLCVSQTDNTCAIVTAANPLPMGSTGIAPTTTLGSTSTVLKASPGSVYSVNVVNSTVAGFLVVYNASSVPASGTTITAANGLYCMPVAASVGFRDTFQPPLLASAGAILLMSTSCTTYTPIGTAPIALTGQAK